MAARLLAFTLGLTISGGTRPGALAEDQVDAVAVQADALLARAREAQARGAMGEANDLARDVVDHFARADRASDPKLAPALVFLAGMLQAGDARSDASWMDTGGGGAWALAHRAHGITSAEDPVHREAAEILVSTAPFGGTSYSVFREALWVLNERNRARIPWSSADRSALYVIAMDLRWADVAASVGPDASAVDAQKHLAAVMDAAQARLHAIGSLVDDPESVLGLAEVNRRIAGRQERAQSLYDEGEDQLARLSRSPTDALWYRADRAHLRGDHATARRIYARWVDAQGVDTSIGRSANGRRLRDALAALDSSWAGLEALRAKHGARAPQVVPALIAYGVARVEVHAAAPEPLLDALRILGKPRPDNWQVHVRAWTVAGWAFTGMTWADEAVDAYRQAITIARAFDGPLSTRVGDAEHGAGVALFGQARSREAIPYFERALRIREAAGGEESIRALRARTNLVASLVDSRQYIAADDLIDALLRHAGQVAREKGSVARDPTLWARALCVALGRYGDLERTVRPLVSGEEAWVSQVRGMLRSGMFRDARNALTAPPPLGMARARTGGANTGPSYDALELGGEVAWALGDDESAAAALEKSWGMVLGTTGGGPHTGLGSGSLRVCATVGRLLAEIRIAQGRLREAVATADLAARDARLWDTLGVGGVHDGRLFSDLGSGGWAKADDDRYFGRGHEYGAMEDVVDRYYWRFMSRSDARDVDLAFGASLTAARAHLAAGNEAPAVQVLQDAAAHLTAMGAGRPTAELVRTLVDLGRLRMLTGDFDGAATSLSRAADASRDASDATAVTRADVALARGDLALARGDRAGARTSFVAAEKGYRDVGEAGDLRTIAAVLGRIRCASTQAEARRELPAGETALAAIRAWIVERCAGATSSERLELRTIATTGIEAWMDVVRTADVHGYDPVYDLSGLLYRIDRSERRAQRSMPSAEWDAIDAARRSLSRVALDMPSFGASRHVWRREYARAAATLATLTRKSKGGKSLDPAALAASFEAGQRSLGAGDAFVHAARIGQGYVAWVLTRNGAPRRVELGDAKALDVTVGRFQEALSSAETEDAAPLEAASTALNGAFWTPVMTAAGTSVSRVFLSLEGSLSSLPLAALRLQDGGEPLGLRLALVQLAAPSDLAAVEEPSGGPERLVTLGAVDYGLPPAPGPGPKAAPRREPFIPLSASGPECDAVAAGFQATHPKGAVTSMRGSTATESELLTRLRGARWLHLATHGTVRRSLMLGGRPAKDPACALSLGLERFATGVDPMTASVLLLAGANAAPKPGDDDGFVTAADVATLPLASADLVVLSACDSARGVESHGEGVLGLARGFRIAGARQVIGTLFPIGDDTTKRWMDAFYAEYWRSGDALRSMRAATAACRASAEPGDRAPRSWAAFVLVQGGPAARPGGAR